MRADIDYFKKFINPKFLKLIDEMRTKIRNSSSEVELIRMNQENCVNKLELEVIERKLEQCAKRTELKEIREDIADVVNRNEFNINC